MQICTMMCRWIKGTATVSIPHTPWCSLPYTLGCMVTGQLMLRLLLIDPQLSGKHWRIESWYKSAVHVPWFSRV